MKDLSLKIVIFLNNHFIHSANIPKAIEKDKLSELNRMTFVGYMSDRDLFLKRYFQKKFYDEEIKKTNAS